MASRRSEFLAEGLFEELFSWFWISFMVVMVLVGMAKTYGVSSLTSKPRASRKEKGKRKAVVEGAGEGDGDDEPREYELKKKQIVEYETQIL